MRRRVGEAFKPECVVPNVKHCGDSIMVWDCMTNSGVGQLFICKGRLISTKYINVLESVLLPSFTTLFGDTKMDGVSVPARQRAMSQICSHYDMVERKLY